MSFTPLRKRNKNNPQKSPLSSSSPSSPSSTKTTGEYTWNYVIFGAIVLCSITALMYLSSGGEERKRALIVVDVQNDFLPPSGSLAVPNGNEVIEPINQLISMKDFFSLIVFTQDWHVADHISFASSHPGHKEFESILLKETQMEQVLWPSHCVENTKGAQFASKLNFDESQHVVVQKGTHKHVDSYSGFMDNDKQSMTPLHSVLSQHGITDVFVTGLAYEYCAAWTALDAKLLGYNVYFIPECSRGLTSEGVAQANTKLVDAGV
eukprot:CAMPEP_0201559950 /NCGR_PEP_ID=MMETSP0173_2-20130828/77301_1 /ASSEMBLY_ACC=CAM_ASM_000268 /TAXON_ID=218659 /ORGANISM="Vexillifera sp., Strain DIVA3 564/2" /LENGTH=264 /DNA_ID=CAMNT_0047974319 /DNA_START=8 /DNA_END=799 /DNA_ORIENTATION=+